MVGDTCIFRIVPIFPIASVMKPNPMKQPVSMKVKPALNPMKRWGLVGIGAFENEVAFLSGGLLKMAKRKARKAIAIASVAIALSAFSLGYAGPISIQGRITKALFSKESEQLYLLSRSDKAVIAYSQDGILRDQIDPTKSSATNGKLSRPQDIVLDESGNILYLAFDMALPEKQSCILGFSAAGEMFASIRPSLPVYAWHMDRDGSGNFYLLGFESGRARPADRMLNPPNTVNLVYKFNSEGQHLGSYLPIKTPQDESLIFCLTQSLPRAISLCCRPAKFGS